MTFAPHLKPPYYAVIFTSQRTSENNGYDEMADYMVELASQQPGFLGVESTRDKNGFGITVSYWQDEDSIQRWRKNAEHREAQHKGKTSWYQHYELRIAKVERVTHK